MIALPHAELLKGRAYFPDTKLHLGVSERLSIFQDRKDAVWLQLGLAVEKISQNRHGPWLTMFDGTAPALGFAEPCLQVACPRL